MENMPNTDEKSNNNTDNPALIKQIVPHGKGVEVGALVKQDIEDRIQLGEKRYGERLKTFNGRNALWDAYQEILDLANYLRQLIEEQRVLAEIPTQEGCLCKRCCQ